MLKIRKRGMIKMLDKPLTMIGILELEKRTKRVIKSFGICDLMEYTIDSCGGCDIVDC